MIHVLNVQGVTVYSMLYVLIRSNSTKDISEFFSTSSPGCAATTDVQDLILHEPTVRKNMT